MMLRCCSRVLLALLAGTLAVLPGAAQEAPAERTPELHVILLGTGYPRPDPDRAGPSTAVIVGEKIFVVDAGRGVIQRLWATGLPLKNIRAVFLTHLHSDHTAGLPDLFNTSWIFGRHASLELYGPPGVGELAQSMLDFFAVDIPIRRDRTEMHPGAGATVNTHLLEEGVVYEDDELRVTAFRVDHRPVEHAFGFRFDLLAPPRPATATSEGDSPRPLGSGDEASASSSALVSPSKGECLGGEGGELGLRAEKKTDGNCPVRAGAEVAVQPRGQSGGCCPGRMGGAAETQSSSETGADSLARVGTITSVVISGDTRPSDNLIKHARGADLLIHEAYLPEHFDQHDTPEVAARLKAYHTSAVEVGQVAARAGVPTLVLTHLVPGDPDSEKIFLERARKRFTGCIIVARDLMQF